jgi:putative flippase GtrA
MSKLIKFSVVGFSGSIINFSIYYLCSIYFGFNINFCSILAFVFAVTSNYIFNSSWTFSTQKPNNYLSIKNWVRYVAGNIQGLLINLFVLNFLVNIIHFQSHILAQIAGIFSGMLFNYYFAKKFVFM